MAINYGCVALAPGRIIVDHADDYNVNYRAVVTSILPNVSASQRKKSLYTYSRCNFAVLLDKGLVCICSTSPDFSVDQSFAFLEDVVEAFSDPQNNNLRESVVESYEDTDGATVARENEMMNVTVVDSSGTKKARKFARTLAKKMKHFSKGKKHKKTKKVPIPGKAKPERASARQESSEPLVSPASKHLKDKYVPLQSGRPHATDEELRIDEDNHSIQKGRYSKPTEATEDQLQKVQRETDEVRGIMKDNLEKVLTRGDKLDELLERAVDLEAAALQFKKTSKSVKRKMIWRNRRRTIGIVAIVLVIVTAVLLVVVFTVIV